MKSAPKTFAFAQWLEVFSEIFAQIARELGMSHEELFTEATELGFGKTGLNPENN
jgi:hypothetical protein